MKKSKWIPAKERSPEKDGYYLVSCKGGSVHLDFYNNYKWDNIMEYTILAWRKIPKAYQEEEEEC